MSSSVQKSMHGDNVSRLKLVLNAGLGIPPMPIASAAMEPKKQRDSNDEKFARQLLDCERTAVALGEYLGNLAYLCGYNKVLEGSGSTYMYYPDDITPPRAVADLIDVCELPNTAQAYIDDALLALLRHLKDNGLRGYKDKEDYMFLVLVKAALSEVSKRLAEQYSKPLDTVASYTELDESQLVELFVRQNILKRA